MVTAIPTLISVPIVGLASVVRRAAVLMVIITVILSWGFWSNLSLATNEIVWIHLPVKMSDVSYRTVSVAKNAIDFSNVSSVIGSYYD